MDLIEVDARFSQDGEVLPLRFTWRGDTYPVDSTGRRWKDDRGHHILVMTLGEQVYELVFVPTETRWYLGRFGRGHRTV